MLSLALVAGAFVGVPASAAVTEELTIPVVTAVTAAAAAAPTGCRTASSKYPWGRQAIRDWTILDDAAPTMRRARLVVGYNRDTAQSAEMVVLESEAGCRTALKARQFAAGDRRYIDTTRAAHRPGADPDTYNTVYDDGLVSRQQVESGLVSTYETQHFTIYYGKNKDAFSYRWQADRSIDWQQGIETLGRWMEETWDATRDITGAPMPSAGDPPGSKGKVNIYICGTGLPWFQDTGDCGASASGQGMFVSAVYILDGSSTMQHEFGHLVQGRTGGFTGGLPGVGNVWEGHANWMSASTGSYFNIWYYQNLENGPTWHTNYYGWFPLLLQLSGRDETSSYLWRAWQENLRDEQGQSKEEFLQTVVRLGQRDGVYPRGLASFADEIGWYGARLAANDFVQGPVFAETMGMPQEASRFVGLVPTDTSDTYASAPERPLWQFGSHLIPLQVDGSTMSATVTGLTAKDGAGWRYALVSVGPDGQVQYSALGAEDGAVGAGTTVSLPATTNARHYLAVSATPTQFRHIGDGDNPPGVTEFPYSVTLTGARPELPGSGTCLGPYTGDGAANLNWKTNGRFTFDKTCADIGPRVRVTAEPRDVTVKQTDRPSFSVAAEGAGTNRIRWQTLRPGETRWQDVAGAGDTTLTLPAGVRDGTKVRALVTGKLDTVVTSRAALVTSTTPPVALTAAVSSELGANAAGWHRSPVKVVINGAAAGITVQSRTDGQGPWAALAGPVTVTRDGVTRVEYRAARGSSPVAGSERAVSVKLDRTAPSTTAATDPATGTAHAGGAVVATFTASDATSGVAYTEYSTDGTRWTRGGRASFTTVGVQTVRYRSVDVAGNTEGTKSVTVTVPPVKTARLTLTSSVTPTAAGWYRQPVTMTFDPVASPQVVQYRLDGGDWQTYTKAVSVSTNGEHTLDHRLSSNGTVTAGSDVRTAVRIDRTRPAVGASTTSATDTGTPSAPLTASIRGRDALSGIANLEYRIDRGPWTTFAAPVVFDRVGQYVLTYRATDKAGNTSYVKSRTVVISPAR